MAVIVDVATLNEVGDRLRAVARTLPEPVRVHGGTSGSGSVDGAVQDYLMSLEHCLVGGATVVYALGQDARSAAAMFVDGDRAMRAVLGG